MSVKLMTAAWECPLPPTEKMVLLCLCDFANDEGDCWPSIATMVKKTSLSERTVQRAVKRLVEAKILTQKERAGTSTNYKIHPRHFDTPVTVTPRHSDTPPPSLCHPTPVTVTPHPRHSDTQTTNEPSKNHHLTTNRTRKASFVFACPNGVDEIDWNGLVDNRRTKRAPMTEAAHRGIIRKLEQWAGEGWPPGPIVAVAAERGWLTVYPTDEMKGLSNDNATGNFGQRNAGGGGRTSGWLA